MTEATAIALDELRDSLMGGKRALAGDSNDAEHDALEELVDAVHHALTDAGIEVPDLRIPYRFEITGTFHAKGDCDAQDHLDSFTRLLSNTDVATDMEASCEQVNE